MRTCVICSRTTRGSVKWQSALKNDKLSVIDPFGRKRERKNREETAYTLHKNTHTPSGACLMAHIPRREDTTPLHERNDHSNTLSSFLRLERSFFFFTITNSFFFFSPRVSLVIIGTGIVCPCTRPSNYYC